MIRHHESITHGVGVALIVAVSVSAQASRGPLPGIPASIAVGPATESSGGPVDPLEMHGKIAGFAGFSPHAPPGAPLEPDFTLAAVLGGAGPAPAVHVDAFSIGLDELHSEIPVGGEAELNVPGGRWTALVFSVDRATTGAPGSVIQHEDTGPGGAAADLFTLVLPGSSFGSAALADCFPTDRPQRAIDALEMDLTSPAGEAEIGAIEVYVPLYETGNPMRGKLSDEPVAFFSVTYDDVFPPGGGSSIAPNAWFTPSSPSPASIVKTRWDSAAGQWTAPQLHLSYSELGLAVDDDIDALAVDRQKSLLLFSIVPTATSTIGDQLQIAHWSSPDDGAPEVGEWVVVGEGGETEPVAGRVGMADAQGNVDGTCTVDPGGQVGALSMAFGSPVDAFPWQKTLASGLYRDADTFGPTITSTVTGLPPGNPLAPRFAQIWGGTPSASGDLVLLPDPLYSEVLDGSGPPHGRRAVSFTHPLLGSELFAELQLFWVVYPGQKQASPLVAIDL